MQPRVLCLGFFQDGNVRVGTIRKTRSFVRGTGRATKIPGSVGISVGSCGSGAPFCLKHKPRAPSRACWEEYPTSISSLANHLS